MTHSPDQDVNAPMSTVLEQIFATPRPVEDSTALDFLGVPTASEDEMDEHWQQRLRGAAHLRARLCSHPWHAKRAAAAAAEGKEAEYWIELAAHSPNLIRQL